MPINQPTFDNDSNTVIPLQVCSVHGTVVIARPSQSYFSMAHVGHSSCRKGRIHFLAGWHKRQPEPGFSFVRFSVALY